MRAAIRGLGEWRPETVRVNADWPAEVVASWAARAPKPGTGAVDDTALVAAPELSEADRLSALGFARDMEDPFLFAQERRVARPHETSIDASVHAGRAALEDAGVSPEQLDVVMVWDAVPDRPGCPAAPKICERLGALRAHGLDIQQACASVISSLELAAALIESGRARHVLLTQTHVGFRLCGFETPTSANVGDLGTAIVVGPSERAGVLTTSIVSDGSFQDAVLLARGKDDETDTPWFVAGGPFVFGTKDRVRAQQMMKDTVKMGALTIREACDRAAIAPRSLDVIAAPHPRRWIPGAIAETLGLRADRAPQTYEEIAHVGGCGAVANLIEARRRGLLTPGALVALYAQGQGMTRGAALVRWGVD
ncbi:MAG: 3-oxoacyl-ACP synthase III family protein [Sandaracinaceae bacterium]|nr:3-oxoacyl-ACP synthase III family protein [Sandaracinaceae bacterium]